LTLCLGTGESLYRSFVYHQLKLEGCSTGKSAGLAPRKAFTGRRTRAGSDAGCQYDMLDTLEDIHDFAPPTPQSEPDGLWLCHMQ
jgi:hypothetical protein